MRVLCKVVLAAAVVGLLAGPALAQQGRFRGGFGGGAFGGGMLLGNKSVQEELKLAKEQVDKAQEELQKIREKQKEAFAKLRDLSQEERQEKFQEFSKTATAETNRIAAAILKPEQLKRFKQIELQQRGYQAFTDPEIQKTLKVTDDQKDKLKTITEDTAKETRELFQSAQGGGNFQEVGKKMQALRKEALERVTSVLTADQKKAWKEMTGEPFEVRMEFPRRPGGN